MKSEIHLAVKESKKYSPEVTLCLSESFEFKITQVFVMCTCVRVNCCLFKSSFGSLLLNLRLIQLWQ